MWFITESYTLPSRAFQNSPKSRLFDPCKINQFLIIINANLIAAYQYNN